MRRAARVDANQKVIVAAFRKLGYSVLHMHTLGQGAPDILVGKRGTCWPVEIKASRRDKLTADEEAFWKDWLGSLLLITSVDEVIEFDRKHFSKQPLPNP